jgi:hypothetical protein
VGHNTRGSSRNILRFDIMCDVKTRETILLPSIFLAILLCLELTSYSRPVFQIVFPYLRIRPTLLILCVLSYKLHRSYYVLNMAYILYRDLNIYSTGLYTSI